MIGIHEKEKKTHHEIYRKDPVRLRERGFTYLQIARVLDAPVAVVAAYIDKSKRLRKKSGVF